MVITPIPCSCTTFFLTSWLNSKDKERRIQLYSNVNFLTAVDSSLNISWVIGNVHDIHIVFIKVFQVFWCNSCNLSTLTLCWRIDRTTLTLNPEAFQFYPLEKTSKNEIFIHKCNKFHSIIKKGNQRLKKTHWDEASSTRDRHYQIIWKS